MLFLLNRLIANNTYIHFHKTSNVDVLSQRDRGKRSEVFQHAGEACHLLLHDSLGALRLFQQHAHLLFHLNHLTKQKQTPAVNTTFITTHVRYLGGVLPAPYLLIGSFYLLLLVAG